MKVRHSECGPHEDSNTILAQKGISVGHNCSQARSISWCWAYFIPEICCCHQEPQPCPSMSYEEI